MTAKERYRKAAGFGRCAAKYIRGEDESGLGRSMAVLAWHHARVFLGHTEAPEAILKALDGLRAARERATFVMVVERGE